MRLRRRRSSAGGVRALPLRGDCVRVSDLLSQLREAEARGTLDEDGRAQLLGLTEPPESLTRFTPEEGEPVPRHALYLLGRLLAFADRAGTPVTRELLTPPATIYCVALAEAAARRAGQLRDARLPVHTYAMVRIERRLKAPLAVADEEVLLGWLTSALRLRPIADSARLLGERRARRHAKLFPGPPAGQEP
jgi:hypothetical protein